MFKQIVVGVDEHKGGRDAIALARNLLAPDGELTLAYVYVGDPHVYRSASSSYDASERERAQELLERARAETGVQANLRWRGSSSVGRGLHELCEVIGADLLVVGSSRRGLLGRVLIGDDTRDALNGAPCAIAIAPAGYAEQPVAMREIGVGYNGSPESEHALEVARKVAAELWRQAVGVRGRVAPDDAFLGGPAPIERRDRGRSSTMPASEIAALGGVEPHAAYGTPAEELAVYSASLDLLIVGSRGYGPIGRLIHGSTSQQLARTARCPLLVLPRSTRPIDTHEPAEDGRETAAPIKA